ncbi:DUF456 domain-containing protein [Actinotalea sp. K2]|uniref:DUF456 domain-containing protein n=1 Tax=Actinotalea sp. K2 TaxID=2939438 RepID=UPI002017321B|nr:DUF456 domain-containing protein [Actinotalea sp. K2]MCL3862185.1 DUF456 domain-containing protein [Actinotalea sp. K2]
MLVGLVGIIVPILPGSMLIAVSTVVWAIGTGSGIGWAVLVVMLALLAVGVAATYVITGKQVSAVGVPNRSLILSGLAGIVGFFVIPVLGLFLFFAATLYLTEHLRLKDARAARRTAGVALRATALGLLVELTLALTATGIWLVVVLTGVAS